VLIGRRQSLKNILVQTTRLYGEWFKIYHVQNLCDCFWNIMYNRIPQNDSIR